MQLQRIAEQAQRSPAMVFNTVLHLIDRDVLREASRQTHKSSAPGMDQGTAQQYADNLDEHLRDLHGRLRGNRYIAPPGERVGIEQEGGKKRPIGKPCCEDKSGQRAVGMILEAIFEHDLHAFSHGCRKGHSPHQALHELREQCRQWHINWRVDAEVSRFFDTIDPGLLREGCKRRVKAGGSLRLSGKWLQAGVGEAGTLTYPDQGTPQGGVATLHTKLRTDC
jgi:RNA-directed DNA polymerase